MAEAPREAARSAIRAMPAPNSVEKIDMNLVSKKTWVRTQTEKPAPASLSFAAGFRYAAETIE